MVLLVLRVTAILKTRFWERDFPWRLPAGRLSLEFSIKFWRQESDGGGPALERSGQSDVETGIGQ